MRRVGVAHGRGPRRWHLLIFNVANSKNQQTRFYTTLLVWVVIQSSTTQRDHALLTWTTNNTGKQGLASIFKKEDFIVTGYNLKHISLSVDE